MPRRLSFAQLTPVQQPLVWLAIAYLLGLLIAARLPDSGSVKPWFIALLSGWTLSALSHWRGHARATFFFLLSGCLFAGGTLWTIQTTNLSDTRIKQQLAHGQLSKTEPVELVGTLVNAPEPAPQRIYLQLTAEQVATRGQRYLASGVIELVVPLPDEQARRDYEMLRLRYGSRVRVLCLINAGAGYQNPGAPAFDELLEYRGFDARGWVKSPLLIEPLPAAAPRNAVFAWLYALRTRALSAILQTCRQPAAGILAASLLGNRYFLDRQAAQTFREGGTFHLLVISGAHVAAIAALLWWLTALSAALVRARFLRVALIGSLLWAYALMIGAQPSITRAVVMVTIALSGQLLFRQTLGANTLAATALALLVWQPHDVFNPAFQLSFLTVAVIVLLTAPVYERMRAIGQWQPTTLTPYPPHTARWLRWLAEVLFWDEREFQETMREARIRYRLAKAPAAHWLNRWHAQAPVRWVLATLFTTVCVQVALLPLLIKHFHRFSLISPLTNLIESGLIFLLMLLGLAQLFVQLFSLRAALWLSPLLHGLGNLMIWLGQKPLALPLASVRVPDWADAAGVRTSLLYGLFFALVLLLVLRLHRWHPLRKADRQMTAARRRGALATWVISGTLLALSALLIAHPFAHQFKRGQLQVSFLDVGQGDAIFLNFPNGKTMLLDSGGRLGYALEQDEISEDIFTEDRIGIAEAAVMPYLWQLGLKRLDFIAATHGDSDHTEGFGDIVKSFVIGDALAGITPTDPALADLYTKAVRACGLPLRNLRHGATFQVDGVQIEVLAPFADQTAQSTTDNNSSLVLRVSYGQHSFLLTGDIERATELRLAGLTQTLRADVLKVAHHGSRTSSHEEFLARVQPRHAVISASAPSPFGHPHAESLERLRTVNAQIWSTGQCGAITFFTNGTDLQITTVNPCAGMAQIDESGAHSPRESQ